MICGTDDSQTERDRPQSIFSKIDQHREPSPSGPPWTANRHGGPGLVLNGNYIEEPTGRKPLNLFR